MPSSPPHAPRQSVRQPRGQNDIFMVCTLAYSSAGGSLAVKGNVDVKAVCELRIDVGAGYRVYYAMDGKTVVLLLCGGDKSTQNADIDRACKYWKDWQRNGKKKK